MHRNTILIIIALILVLIVIVVTNLTINRGPSQFISSVTPQENSITNTLFPLIQITFLNSLNESQKSNVRLEADPRIEGSQSWSSDNRILTFNLKKPLIIEKKYNLIIFLGRSSYSWTFSTPAVSAVSQEEQLKLQAEADRNYAQAQQKVIDEFPWYNNLPIKSVTYFVYLDVNSKAIKAKLYPQKSSPTPIEEQVRIIQSEVTNKLRGIGVDVSKQKIEWIILPE